jgi:hypothetical protein
MISCNRNDGKAPDLWPLPPEACSHGVKEEYRNNKNPRNPRNDEFAK